jgi:hypothetical protein
VPVFFRPAYGLWRSAASTFENQSGANGLRFGCDDEEGVLPIRPDSPGDYPEKLIEGVEAQARMSTLQRGELLTQSEILEKKTSPPAKEGYHHSKAEPDEAKHGQDL